MIFLIWTFIFVQIRFFKISFLSFFFTFFGKIGFMTIMLLKVYIYFYMTAQQLFLKKKQILGYFFQLFSTFFNKR
jgi:hypothetical protein